MAHIVFPVYMNTPLDLQTCINMARSVKIGCLAYNLQERVLLRSRLSEAQNHRCCWCARPFADADRKADSPTLEHVVPKSQGGTDHPDNLAVACTRCNEKRGTKSIDAFSEHARAVGWADPRLQH